MLRRLLTSRSFVAVLTVALVLLTGCGGDGSPGPGSQDNPPGAPGELQSTDQVQGVTLVWSAVSADDLAGYNVYRDTESFASLSGRSPVNDAPLADPTYRDEGVDTGSTYYYRVTAVDAGDNEGNPSNQISVTVFPTPPDRPSE